MPWIIGYTRFLCRYFTIHYTIAAIAVMAYNIAALYNSVYKAAMLYTLGFSG